MSLSQQLQQELNRLSAQGPIAGCSLVFAEASDLLEVDLAALDTMSCAMNELRLTLPRLQNGTNDAIKRWADDLSRRITYLLEQIGPIEFDDQAGSAMIRSNQPTQLPSGAVYYEFVLQSASKNAVTINRFEIVKGQPGRKRVTLQLTHEVLVKLVNDLLDTCPIP
ncbi:hypothetical protein [uncultured Rubinisphaera sp.]|uniref:hypothetical protein n=2 Tax=Rubinisphaera TaxID=1649490 RepID=UPI0030DDBCD3|tara:strand:- start:5161 stop:5658 length:498 start_codon:yes stop_codon:yes gene_type:complete